VEEVDTSEAVLKTVKCRTEQKTVGRKTNVNRYVEELQQKEGYVYAYAIVKTKEKKLRVVVWDSIIMTLDNTINTGRIQVYLCKGHW